MIYKILGCLRIKDQVGTKFIVTLLTLTLYHQVESGVDQRMKVMVIGGLYGAQPVGRELVLRLARHLAAGWYKEDEDIRTLLRTTSITLVPAVDLKGFDAAKPGHIYCVFIIHIGSVD